MNYWSSEFSFSGEREALSFVARKLSGKNRPVIFDVGANIGEFTLACIDTFGHNCQIYAFEPSADTFKRLLRNIENSEVHPHRLAFSDRCGTATLHTSEPESSIASLIDLDRPVRPFDKSLDEEVYVDTIDHFCEKFNIVNINFLKLDIEGHELNALCGSSRMIENGKIDIIQFEFGENNISSRSFISDFTHILKNYEIYVIAPGGPVEWHYEGGRSEIFATMNYLAVRRDICWGIC